MSRLTDAITAERRRLAQREADAVRRLLAYHDVILDALTDDLQAVTEMIDAAIRNGEPVNIDWLRRQERYHRLMDDVQAHYRRYALIAQDEAASAQWAGVQQGASDAVERVAAMGLTTQTMYARVNVPALERLMGALSPGSPLRQVIDRYGDTAASIIEQELIAGMGRGAGPREVARLIRNRVEGITASRSRSLIRTEMLRAYRGSLFDQYAQMGFQQWRWMAAHSTRTCLGCLSMSGRVFDMDDPFMAAHVNCRCSPAPVHPNANVKVQSGEEWFANQPEDVQRRMIGNKEAFTAYRNGSLKLDDFRGEVENPVWGRSVFQRSGRSALKGDGSGTLEPPKPMRDIPAPPSSFKNKADAQAYFERIGLTVDEMAGNKAVWKEVADAYHREMSAGGAVPPRLSFVGKTKRTPVAQWETLTDMQTGEVRVDRMNIYPKNPFWTNRDATLQKMQGWMVPENVDDVIRHELGHRHHSANVKWVDQYQYEFRAPGGTYSKNLPDDFYEAQAEKSIMRRVSRYPAEARSDNRLEFVAETYTGLRKGIKYDDEVMDLYRKLGGPEVP